MRVISLTFLWFMCLSSLVSNLVFSAHADTVEDIQLNLQSGHFEQAVDQGKALGTPDGFILAAEALNAKLLLGQAKHRTKTAKAAMKLAKNALELDPNNAEAQIQYALSYGFYGRYASSFKAWRKKLAPKIKAEIDKAEAMAPKDARVKALQGAWHLNLLYRANGYDVGKHFGADAQKGRQYFQEALQQNPDSRIIIYANLLMLDYVLSPKTNAAQTKQALEKTLLSMQPHDAVERQVLQQMQTVYNGFETGDALKRAKLFITQ